tara:strand:+ start:166 stop:552 length:387 start_codon:yes stop_codon:yes gene_type:complete
MPFEFKEYDKGLFVRYFGFVPPSDFFESRVAIRALPNHDKFEYALCDFSDMDADCIWSMTREMADSVGERDADVPSNQDGFRKMAMVAQNQKVLELLEYYVGHYQSAPNAEYRLFRSVQQAWAWIGDP